MIDSELLLTDVSLTDGQCSVWGEPLTTSMAINLAGHLSGAGLAAVEVLSPEIIMGCLKRGEDPWRRIEMIRVQAPKLRLRGVLNQLTSHGIQGLDVLPDDVLCDWVEQMSDAGINEILVVDPMLNEARFKAVFTKCRDVGVKAIAALPFVEDMNDQSLASTAKMLKSCGVNSIQLRDEAGLLSAERLKSLLPVLHLQLGSSPISLHTTCVTGLGPLVIFEAIKQGVREIDTCLPTLANGPSLPSSVNLLKGIPAIGMSTSTPDLKALQKADVWLQNLAAREGLEASRPWNFDLAPYIHRLSGSAARFSYDALRGTGSWHLLHRFSHECARIAKEAGGVPIQAPFAQAIAQQALWHLADEKRWVRIHPVLRRAIQGVYGQAPQHVQPCQELATRMGYVAHISRKTTKLKGHLAAQIGGKPIGKTSTQEYVDTTPIAMLTQALLCHLQKGDGFSNVVVTGPDVQVHLHLNRGENVSES